MRTRPPFVASPLRVWAVDSHSVQVCWGALDEGEVVVRVGAGERIVEHPGGPGACTVDGLEPSTLHPIEVRAGGAVHRLEARTSTPPPGELLARVATVSDLHLGAGHWGFLRTMVDLSGHPDPPPTRSARAAVDEATAWGAQLLVIKGDAAHHRRADHFAAVGDLVDRHPTLPIRLLPGNHDVDHRANTELPQTVGRRAVAYERTICVDDLPGIRVIGVNTTLFEQGIGTLTTNGPAAIEAAAAADTGVLLLLHHQIQEHAVPTHYPPGIPRSEGADFLRALTAATPDVLVSSGHTHRNRARRHGPIQLTEVASTRDWPGVWAGYEIREGGISQVVRRIEAHDAITWHEYSRGAVGGIWSRWAPGPLDQRCLSKRWSHHHDLLSR